MEFQIFDLGVLDYWKSRRFQKEVFSSVEAGVISSALIILRHYPVITMGRLADKKNVLIPLGQLEKEGIQLYQSERGGDVTYHGPGQLTVYPICNLEYFKKDLHWYLRALEEAVIRCVAGFGIRGRRKDGLPGVWVGERKLCSVGIAVSRWITFHGLSVNIKEDDLSHFSLIRPCGLDIEMTSMESELRSGIEIESVKESLIHWLRESLSAGRETAPCVLSRR